MTQIHSLAALNGASVITEDCLLLDVYVPDSVYQNKDTVKVPVIVDVHGGGYVGGHKGLNTPLGLYTAAGNLNQTFVYVSGNYRV